MWQICGWPPDLQPCSLQGCSAGRWHQEGRPAAAGTFSPCWLWLSSDYWWTGPLKTERTALLDRMLPPAQSPTSGHRIKGQQLKYRLEQKPSVITWWAMNLYDQQFDKHLHVLSVCESTSLLRHFYWHDLHLHLLTLWCLIYHISQQTHSHVTEWKNIKMCLLLEDNRLSSSPWIEYYPWERLKDRNESCSWFLDSSLRSNILTGPRIRKQIKSFQCFLLE